MQVGPCIPVGTQQMQLYKAEVGPPSGPTWRPSHLHGVLEARGREPDRNRVAGQRAPERHDHNLS
jgi:hypothetical protein